MLGRSPRAPEPSCRLLAPDTLGWRALAGAVPVERARAEVAVLAIYSEDARHVARIKAALDGGEPVVSTHGWEQFEQVFPRAACSIAVVEWLRGSAVFPRLTSLSARFRLQPIVLVTSKDADNA